jgi:hypothetical protein
MLPLTAFVKDRFATPDSEQSKAVLNEQFDEAAFQNLDPYQQFLKEAGNSKKKKKRAKKKLVESVSAQIGNLDIRHLAVEEVLCGPRNEKWGSNEPIDWSRIRTFCLSPLIMGQGIVWVGPIEAFKRKKGRHKPVATPTPTVTPNADGPQTLVVEQLPANIYVQFSEGTGIYQVELLDPAGYHYKTLFRQRISSSQEKWVEWDGLDEAGLEAPPGVYQVVLTKDGLHLKKIPLFLKGKNP